MWPRVEEINRHFESYAALTHDELRAKTQEFKGRINEGLQPYHEKLSALKVQGAEGEDAQAQAARFEEYDATLKERDSALEDILQQLLPEAFAVVKETARRLTQHSELKVTATELDRELAAEGKDFVRIDGEHALYSNRWTAAGPRSFGTWCITMFSLSGAWCCILAKFLKCQRAKAKPWFPPCLLI